MKNLMKLSAISSLIGVSLLLQGCPKDDDKDSKDKIYSYSIEVTNLTNHQALSPAGVILHKEGYHAFMSGNMASSALEILAEGGDNSALLTEADNDENVVATVSGMGSIAPGAVEMIQIEGSSTAMKLSLVSMLVNTNDGFTAANAVDINNLEPNESVTLFTSVYDAGTEGNDEAGHSLPGQGGEGYNVDRDDRDFVAIHPGIVTANDGLTSSVLDPSHRFDNPATRIVVTRTN